MKQKTYYLYHKKSPFGLNYLGMTTKQDPFSYMGSGKYWKLHLKKHNLKSKDIQTIILFETINQNELREKGTYYSKLYNVIKSEEWANLIDETGEGVSGNKLTEEHKNKIRKAGMGRILSPESLKIIADKNRGKKRTKKTKEKMRLARLGKPGIKHTQKTKEKIRKSKLGKLKPGVKVIHKETGEIFESITKAAIAYNLNKITLISHIKKNKPGCQFEYIDSNYKKTRKGNKGIKFSNQAKINMSLNNGQRVKLIHKDSGKIFPSIVEAAKFTGIKANSLSAQLANSRKCAFSYL